VPLFLTVSGLLLVVAGQLLPESHLWSARGVAETVYMAIGPMAAAYGLWEVGLRRGNHLLLSLASYFLPVTATAVAAAYLHVVPGPWLWAGCGLVTLGALICRYSLAEEPAAADRPLPPPRDVARQA
jgi:drug/metabolite transporter (DMT)-like permease